MNPSAHPSTRARLHAWLWPAVVFVVGATVAIFVWLWVADFVSRGERERFEFQVAESISTLVNRVHAQRNILRGGSGLFAAADDVSRAEWREYVNSLRAETFFPGMQGLGYTVSLEASDLSDHVAVMQSEYARDYQVRPVGERHDYTAIVFLEPLDLRNREAIGFDMFSEPVRRAAMEQARDTHRTALSGKVTLVQEIDEDVQAGFLMYLPVYAKHLPIETVAERRAALQGYVYSPFRAGEFVRGTFPGGLSGMDVQIFDGSVPRSSALLFPGFESLPGDSAGFPSLATDRVIEVFGHPWTLRFSARPSFFQSGQHFLPPVVFAAIFLPSVLFGLLVWAQGNTREEARRLALEITARRDAEAETARLNEQLEQLVRDRTEALEQTTQVLRESEERFRLMVDGVNDYAILMLDAGGRVSSWNAGAEQVQGYIASQIMGAHFSRFYPPEAVEAGDPGRQLAVAAKEGRVEDEGWRVRKDGSTFWASVVLTAVRDKTGTLRGYSQITRDVTERKRAQDEIRQLNTELEERVEERTKDLKSARSAALGLMQDAQMQKQQLEESLVAQRSLAGRLEAANKELESFSYSVSHDLRAPLRHIQGYVEMLNRETGEHLSAKAQRFLKTIASSAHEMGALIDDLLAFSRMGRTEMRDAPVDSNMLVGEVIRNLEPETNGREILWRVGSLPTVRGDASMLRQVWVNLIGNAIKYTRLRDPAEIEIGCDESAANQPVFFVRDNGAGFEMDYADKLFGVFQRLHRADEFEGTGIGLANVRRIINRHGGRTWAEGKVNAGASFYFTLSSAAAETLSKKNEHEPETNSAGR